MQTKCADTPSPSRPVVPRLPPELITHIINFLGDYELASTLGVPHEIPETAVWSEQATQLDRAILTGSLRVVQDRYGAGHRTFSQWGSRVMLRFGYTGMLEWFRSEEAAQLHRTCDDLLPIIASAWGRVNVLRWALDSGFGVRPHVSPSATNQESPMDVASTDGHVETLEFWRTSGLPLVYSELALNGATRYSEFACLEWWKTSGLPLKIGNVLDYASMDQSAQTLGWWARSGLEGKYSKKALYHASCAGSLAVLDWWKASGLALLYDEDVVVGATKHGRVDCLDWWERSALELKYTAFEIEEAIEDCLAGGDAREEVKRWWTQRGLLRDEGDWTKPRLLSSRR